MKTHKIASTLALALGFASSGAFAGGIQIDPTGTGSIAGSKFLDEASLGSSFGNFLAETILGTAAQQLLGLTPTGTIHGHNAIALGSFGVPGAELTLEFSIDVLPTVTGGAAIGQQLSFVIDPAGSQLFTLYFDPTADASAAAGTGYGAGGDSVPIATSLSVAFLGTAAITNTTGGVKLTPGCIDGNGDGVCDLGPNSTVDTIGTNGSIFLEIDFAAAGIDTNYIVNDLSGLAVDITTDNSLTTPFPAQVAVSALVAGVAPFYGTDDTTGDGTGDNNFGCGALEDCDFQAKMNTTFFVPASRVPEPGTLALIGAGFGLLGVYSRRRKLKV